MKAMEEFECLKVSPLNCVYDDLHMKKELEQDIRGWMEEKFKKLEAQIKKIGGNWITNWFPEFSIRDSLKDMDNCLCNKFNVLYQHFS